jgi:hypothetical protein
VRGVWSELGLDRFFDDYSGNIARFKKLVAAITTGVDGLTTESRLAWWRTHRLPQTVEYFAITASMADPDAPDEQELARNPYAYDGDSPDDQTLRQGFRDFKRASGFALNDSQMAVHKAVFWPLVIQGLNPDNAGLRTHWLGVVGSHHWGVALDVVSRQSSGSVNPFPRGALLKALAAATLPVNGR